jgi:V-type H+-transporting ATPase 16kDa proteolipid subunit
MSSAGYETCPTFAPIFGYGGAAACMILANFGSAWGTWKAGMGVCRAGIGYPQGVIKNIVPIVMAGVLGIYGLIVAVIISQSISSPAYDGTTTYSLYSAYAHLAAGLCCGLSCLAAGGTIGVIGDVGVQAVGLKAGPKRMLTFAMHSERGGANSADDGADAATDAMDAQLAQEGANKLYVGLLIMLIFAEALALYGLIVALIVSQSQYSCDGYNN